MKIFYMFFLVLFSLVALAQPKSVVEQQGKRALDYGPEKLEHYLSPKREAYVRPGLNISIEGVTFSGDHAQVEIRVYDDRQQPLDRHGNVTPGSISISFILAHYDAATRAYTAYTVRTANSSITGNSATQATSDRGGTWTDMAVGHYMYTFATATPADVLQAHKTNTVAIYATRSTRDIVGKNYYANALYDFRPDGEMVTEAWDGVATDTCNSCHDPLAIHGGSRREAKLCVTCHSPQSSDPDTGNTVDMKVMIHKIHMGENLPSVQAGTPYQIIGFRNSVHDYSHVAYPQSILNCDSCHVGTTEDDIHLTRPSRESCGSCHDLVDWVTGEGHRAGPQADDSACANCHPPAGEAEFDISVAGAHVNPIKSQQLKGLNMEVVSVADAEPGQQPLVTFKLFENDGTPIAPEELDRLRLYIAGPNTEYRDFIREGGTGAEFDGVNATLRFGSALPADADGNWTVTAELYRNVSVFSARGEEIGVREAGFNPLFDIPIGDAAPESRRQIIDNDKCFTCHESSLRLHGQQRLNPNQCVVCHTPEGTDVAVRPSDTGEPESIHFKWLIHRLHKGEALSKDFTVYGFRSSVHNYNDLVYPGDLRNCESCHLPGTYSLPVASAARATSTLREPFSPMLPATSACLSCHESLDAAAHAFVNVAPFGESCASCHGPDRAFSVEESHAR